MKCFPGTTFKTQKQLKETLNKQPNKPWKKSQTSTNPKAALKSKIVAEFRVSLQVEIFCCTNLRPGAVAFA